MGLGLLETAVLSGGLGLGLLVGGREPDDLGFKSSNGLGLGLLLGVL